MTRVEQLEEAVDSLAAEEYRQFRTWFLQRDWAEWDQKIEKDSTSGKLDFLLNEATEEKQQGRLRPL
jgi:hypothetical protein